MRFDRLALTVFLVPLDFLVIVFAGLTAWALRMSAAVQEIRPVLFTATLTFSQYVSSLLIAAAFTVVAIGAVGLYRFPKPDIGMAGIAIRLSIATSATLAAIALTFFFRQELFASRFLVLVSWVLATSFLLIERGLVVIIERKLARRFGIGTRKAILIGNDAVSDELVATLERDPALGFRVVKRLSEPRLEEVLAAIGALGAEAVILGNPNYPRESVVGLIDLAQEKHLLFFFVPNLFQSLTKNASVAVLGNVPVVELRRTALEGWGRVFKRTTDIIGSLIAIILFLPLIAAIAIAIKLDDPEGPVIYKNLRAGKHGKPFFTLKFRSMYWKYSTGPGTPNPEAAIRFEEELARTRSVRRGPVWKILNDPRRTRVGRFLERTSLDELPQFFNVLKGEMSLVGPRPHMLEQVARYEKGQRRVLAMRPGITGLAQISGRSDLDFDEEVRLDTQYMEEWSPWLDLKIIAMTPFVVLFRRHRS
jgi:exopolysaccharide biosynthesis polyprenyl glycosylphosphotransferase